VVTTPRAERESSGDKPVPASDSGLYCLSYVSTQAASMTGDTLKRILEEAYRHNAAAGITGLLLHRDDSFFQILEGDREVVLDLFERIVADDRHERVEIVAEGPIDHREFKDWQMAFIELDGQDLSALPGFSDLMRDTPSAKAFLQSLSRSKKLALLFSVME
jgi:hypothetical protein